MKELIVIIVVVALALAVYFLFLKPEQPEPTPVLEVQPTPTPHLETREPGDWGLTEEQLKKLEESGEIWSVVDITPDNWTWDPPIEVPFPLKKPAPRDEFELTIREWRESSKGWEVAGSAIAKHEGDDVAMGEIERTCLFALVLVLDVPTTVPVEVESTAAPAAP